MPIDIVYLPSVVQKDIPQLPSGLKVKIRKLIEITLTVNPQKKGKPLLYRLSGYRRLRLGHYRVIFRVDEARERVTIVAIGHRKYVYENSGSVH